MSDELEFRRSSFCSGGSGCIEVARSAVDGSFIIRQSRDRVNLLKVSSEAWVALVAEVKAERFDELI